MVLILVLIYWAKQPMTFPRSWRRVLITTAITTAALTPTGLLDGDASWFASKAAAQQSFGRSSSLNGGSGLSGGSGTRNSIGSNYGAASQAPASQGNPGIPTAGNGRLPTTTLAKPTVRLRQDTLIPGTTGRVAMLGRRWVFISDGSAPRKQPVRATDPYNASPSFGADEFTSGQTNLSDTGLLTRTTSLTYTEATTQRRATQLKQLPDLLIVENLMLQRIVESIREDSADDHWHITGKVTEYFDENRLIILSAKRAADEP